MAQDIICLINERKHSLRFYITSLICMMHIYFILIFFFIRGAVWSLLAKPEGPTEHRE
jgi:type III secretory pathway component EscT